METRERILEAAARVFAAHGYSAGTTNRIAAAAGLSIGSLYQYFPNKDAILVELVKAHATDGLLAVQRHLAEASSDPGAEPLDATVRRFVRAAVENHDGDPRLHQVLFEEAPRPPELLELLHEAEHLLVDAAAQLLDAHPEVGVADTAMAARLAVSAVESLVHRYFAAGAPGDTAAFEDELVAMLTRYLRG